MKSGMENRRSVARRALAWAVALSALAGTSASVGAQEPPEQPIVYPEAAGTTIIHGEGVVGITFMLPETIRVWRRNLTLEVDEGTGFAWAGVRAKHYETGDEFCLFCFHFTSFYPEFDRNGPNYAWCSDDDAKEIGCRHPAGLVEVYIVTDGSLTYTIEFEGLEGTTELTATAAVDGAVEQLPIRGCDQMPDGTCGRIYGGTSRAIGGDGRPALGWVVGYVSAPGSEIGPVGGLNPGVVDLRTCAYPSSLFAGSKSGDPNDHPRGCDDEFIGPETNGSGGKKGDVNWRADGEQYLGFSVLNRRAFDPGFWNAWGMWLEAGMVCNSRDFHDCTKPPPDDD